LGLVWFGLVWFGLVWFGLVWFGLVWFGFHYIGFCFVSVCLFYFIETFNNSNIFGFRKILKLFLLGFVCLIH
jgi:hypothetical protein